jgi:hypothetical protein
VKSIFVGLGVLFVFWALAPLTVLWIVGERIQGRHGFPLSAGEYGTWPSWQMLMLMIGMFLWVIMIGALRG